jgi:hypothetical protein
MTLAFESQPVKGYLYSEFIDQDVWTGVHIPRDSSFKLALHPSTPSIIIHPGPVQIP